MRKPSAVLGFLPVAVVLAGAPCHAADWTVRLEPVAVQTYGHDTHVLTVHSRDTVAPTTDNQATTHIASGDGFTVNGRVQRMGEQWGVGLDWFYFRTTQGVVRRSTAAAGAGTQVEFETADRTYTSNGPGEVLYFSTLDDTDLLAMAADVYAIRVLSKTSDSEVRLQLGVRIGDFDNDYVAIVGIQGNSGTYFDGQSNYPTLYGPIVGISGTARHGRSRFEASLSQSIVTGTANLAHSATDYSGNFTGDPATLTVTGQEGFSTDRDVSIPISELRAGWTYAITDSIGLGLGANVSVWSDVQVPPSVVPGSSGASFDQDTIVFYGLLAGAEYRF